MMRLSGEQITTVLNITHEVMGDDATISVFGSRLDDARRGGDLDLLLESPQRPTLLQRAELKLRLEAALDMPVDIVARAIGAAPTPFQRVAMARSIPLESGR